jgi:hypothetical protein
MKEYREAKKSRRGGAKVSCFTPIPQLTEKFQDKFTEFYADLMIFSQQYRNNSEIVMIEEMNQNIQAFIAEERKHFYKQSQEIIEAYILKKNPSDSELEILDALKEAKYDTFFLLSKSENSAVIMDNDEKLYNIASLHSPFTNIFDMKKKYLGLFTALIPYKDCYITDGIYEGFNTTHEMDKYLNDFLYTASVIHFNKKKSLRAIPLVINFLLATQADKFEQMEDIVLKKIPEKFIKSFLTLFENQYSHREELVTSFFRSSDLNNTYNLEENKEDFSTLISAASVENFNLNGDNNAIPYTVLEKSYQQKSLQAGAANSIYKNIQKAKNIPNQEQILLTSFYTMLGIVYVDEDLLNDLINFLDIFNTKEGRTEISIGADALFEELSDEYGFDMFSVYLGLGLDLNSISDHVEEYRKYTKWKIFQTHESIKKYPYRS